MQALTNPDAIDILILLVFAIAGCGISYLLGKKEGRDEVLAQQQEDVLAQGRRRDELEGNGRKCTVCGGRLQYDEGQWWHVDTAPERGRHAPVPDFMVGPAQTA